MSQMISYILYDDATGELLGGYLQFPLPEHTHYIVVDDETRLWWPMLMLNADRTGVVKNPVYFPDEFPPVDPETDPVPEDPPIDPDPEPPVQSGN